MSRIIEKCFLKQSIYFRGNKRKRFSIDEEGVQWIESDDTETRIKFDDGHVLIIPESNLSAEVSA